MENEKTDSCALVTVEEVEAELIFNPRSKELKQGYGSRKIVRESIVSQLSESHEAFRFDKPEFKNEIVPIKREKNIDKVLNVIKSHRVCNRADIANATGLSQQTITRYVNELFELGIIEEGMLNNVFYYRAALK